jgi:hypothetical protein
MAPNDRPAAAPIVPQLGRIDVEAPFRKYRRAELVNEQFGIDGCEPFFWGYHNPARRWNGWATPGFCREVAGLVAIWVNSIDAGTAWWEGDILHVVGGDGSYVDQIQPDDLGLYRFDGWIWLEASNPS